MRRLKELMKIIGFRLLMFGGMVEEYAYMKLFFKKNLNRDPLERRILLLDYVKRKRFS